MNAYYFMGDNFEHLEKKIYQKAFTKLTPLLKAIN